MKIVFFHRIIFYHISCRSENKLARSSCETLTTNESMNCVDYVRTCGRGNPGRTHPTLSLHVHRFPELLSHVLLFLWTLIVHLDYAAFSDNLQ